MKKKKEPNNEASELMDRFSKGFFIAIEHTSATSPRDLDDFIDLLNSDILDRYNLKWCQAIWKDEKMERIKWELRKI